VAITATQAAYQCTNDEWYLHGDKCYKYFEEEKVYGSARKACKAEGGQLAIIDTPDRASFLQSNFDESGWIGGSVDFSDGSVTWLSDISRWVGGAEHESETMWAADEPQDDKGQCGRLRLVMDAPKPGGGYGEQWDAVWCKTPSAYYCEMAAEVHCDDGWYAFGDKCYTFINKPLKYGPAKQACKAQGGIVAIVDNAEKAAFLQANFDESGWIGGSVDFEDGSVSWLEEGGIKWGPAVSAGDLADMWMTDEPHDDKGQCGRLRLTMDAPKPGGGYGERWDAAWCKDPAPFYCQK